MTYIRPTDAALSPPQVLCQAKYACPVFDMNRVFAAAIGSRDGSFLAEFSMIKCGLESLYQIGVAPGLVAPSKSFVARDLGVIIEIVRI